LKDEWRALEMEHLSLWGFYGQKLKGGLLYWGTLKDMPSKALEMGACFHSDPFSTASKRRVKFLFNRSTLTEEFIKVKVNV
jgi:hypothetical protein